MQLDELIIDPEFRNLVPPLSSAEYDLLEENIVAENRVIDPIIVWGNIIVDGHNRYSILQKHPEIPFEVFQKDFSDRDDAIVWICKNQIGRRNVDEVNWAILLGCAMEAQKRIDKSYVNYVNRDERGYFLPSESSQRTSDKIAEEYGTTRSAVERANRFVRGLQEIEQAIPGTTERIKRGELEVTKKDVMALTAMDNDEDKADAIRTIVAGKRIEPITRSHEIAEPYNVTDFRSELHRKAETLDKSLELTCCMVHPEMLETEEGRDALNDALLEITEVVKKYMAYC